MLSDQPLSLRAENALQAHIRNCGRCSRLERGWAQVQHLLQDVETAAPAPGFLDRFQQRLETHQRIQDRRLSWAFFILSASAAGFAFVLFFSFLLRQWHSLMGLVSGWIEQVIDWLLFLQFAQGIFIDLLQTLPPAVPFPLWMGVFALIGGAAILWLKTLRKLAYYQGYHQWA